MYSPFLIHYSTQPIYYISYYSYYAHLIVIPVYIPIFFIASIIFNSCKFLQNHSIKFTNTSNFHHHFIYLHTKIILLYQIILLHIWNNNKNILVYLYHHSLKILTFPCLFTYAQNPLIKNTSI